jgi:hypothetical protein
MYFNLEDACSSAYCVILQRNQRNQGNCQMEWILKKGRTDPDAAAIALLLAKQKLPKGMKRPVLR